MAALAISARRVAHARTPVILKTNRTMSSGKTMGQKMNDECDLPSIQQIIEKGDSLGGVPMSDEEAAYWFDETCASNRKQKSPDF